MDEPGRLEKTLDKTDVPKISAHNAKVAWSNLRANAILALRKRGLVQSEWHSRIGGAAWLIAELGLIFLWTAFVTRPYLNLDPNVVPIGREYLQHIHPHHLWLRALECGWCALWNGGVRGGYPAFADLQGSTLHPLVMVTTLGWGVVNGSKLALVGAFVMSGLAQWWLARVLGLGRVARMWSAALGIAGGHLAGRMEAGTFGLIFSTAVCTLVLPAVLTLYRQRTRRAAIVLGVILALAAVAGQGYMQVAFALMLPVGLIVLLRGRWDLQMLMRRYALALGLALLLAAPFVIPFLHFSQEFVKDGDPGFKSAQPLPYVPLNLVIDDRGFYRNEALQKLPFPWLYVNFIGWIPVLLALWGLVRGKNGDERRMIAFLATLALLTFFLASAIPFNWVVQVPSPIFIQLIGSIRYPPVIASLAVPPILALAAIGLDHIVKASWPRFQLSVEGRGTAASPFSLDSRYLLALPLIFSMLSAQTFGSQWIQTAPLGAGVLRVLQALRTPDLQWVDTPFGEQYWIEPAQQLGLKLSRGTQGWFWRDRRLPTPTLVATPVGPPPGMTLKVKVDGINIYAAPAGREYAAITHSDNTRTVCSAHGIGGEIDVTCNAPPLQDLRQAGTLIVEENSWSGWQASEDGKPLKLNAGTWLSVDVAAGSHTIQFRYRPWDVPLGLILAGFGLILCIYFWRKNDERGAVVAPPLQDLRHNSAP